LARDKLRARLTGKIKKLAPAFHSSYGAPGRLLVGIAGRLINQVGFLGRLMRTLPLSFNSHLNRHALMWALSKKELFRAFWGTFLLMAGTGLLMGYFWSLIWFKLLSNLGGSLALINLLVSIQIQVISPFFLALIVIVAYMGPMTMELSLLKSSKQFETLFLMGVPPAHALAWPRIVGPLISFPLNLFFFNLATALGAYLGAWWYASHPLVDFYLSLYQELKSVNVILLLFQSFLLPLVMSFFSLFNAWESEEGDFTKASNIVRRAMIESFFFATLTGVCVTVVYA
jgi:phospholipid/cholesterol/gamma-HCH transport system permease protein